MVEFTDCPLLTIRFDGSGEMEKSLGGRTVKVTTMECDVLPLVLVTLIYASSWCYIHRRRDDACFLNVFVFGSTA